LGAVAGRVRQRHEHLALLAAPFPDVGFDQRGADLEALSDEHLVKAGGREPLLLRRPRPGLAEQLVHSGPYAIEYRRRALALLAGPRLRST
jgi:hypothetical protein